MPWARRHSRARLPQSKSRREWRAGDRNQGQGAKDQKRGCEGDHRTRPRSGRRNAEDQDWHAKWQNQHREQKSPAPQADRQRRADRADQGQGGGTCNKRKSDAPKLVRRQVEHEAKKGRGGGKRQTGQDPMGETFHKNDQFQRRAAGQKEIERTILVIGLKQPVEPKQGREQAGDPKNCGSDLAEKREIRADRESAQGDEDKKKYHAEAGAAADPPTGPHFANEECIKTRSQRGAFRRVLNIFHANAPSRSSWPGRPSLAWVAATIMPPCAICAAMISAMSAWEAASRAVVGSSRSHTGRFTTRSLASAARRFCPAER